MNTSMAGKYLKLCHNDKVLKNILGVNTVMLKKNIDLITKFDMLNRTLLKEKKFLNEVLSQGLSRAGLIRMAILLLNNGRFKAVDEKKLKLSKTHIRALNSIHKSLSDIKGRINDRRLYKILSDADLNAVESMIIFSLIKKRDPKECIKKARAFTKMKKKPLINGKEIQNILNIGPGIETGRVLSLIEEEMFLGNINGKKEARIYIKTGINT
jgi:hypothetical protein